MLAAWLFRNRTAEGRKLYTIGSNPLAARILGLPIAGLTITVYKIAGLCAGITGVLLAGYSSSATLDMGDALLMPSSRRRHRGSAGLAEMTRLELTSDLPTPEQARLLDAVLLTLVEHGATLMAIASRLTHFAAPEWLQAAVAAGLCGCKNSRMVTPPACAIVAA